jgi:hypothetical protein
VRPRQARYQAALRPDIIAVLILKQFVTLLLILPLFFAADCSRMVAPVCAHNSGAGH